MDVTSKNSLNRPARPRDRRRSGNVLIESIFTMLPMLALIFGFFDFGMLFYRWSTLQNAVREGCRYAITFQTSGTSGQDASIEAIVAQYAMGIVTASDSPQHIFVNYYSPTALTTAIPYASGGNVPGNLVQVSVQNVSWTMMAPISGSFSNGNFFRSTTPVGLAVYSSDILGSFPAGVNSVAR